MNEEYETVEKYVGIADIENYVASTNPRDLRPAHIKRLKGAFNVVKSVEGVIATNAQSQKKQEEVIDGNHRIVAIREWLEEHPNDKIRATFHIYRNLTEEQKKATFAKLNNSVAMTKTDLIKTQCYDSFIYRAFFDPLHKKPFPCNVSINESDKRSTIKFLRLIEPYNSRDTMASSNLALRNIVSVVNKMDKDDLARMSQYMEDFIEIFGEPHSETNRLYSGMVFHLGFQKIYWQGNNVLGRANFKATMKRNYAQIRGMIESELVKKTGIRWQTEFVYTTILKALNKWEKRSMRNKMEITEEK